MSMAEQDPHLSDAELADLAAFADGSLPPARREQVAARIEGSPELRALVDEQRAAVDAVRALDVLAPASLRARLEADARPRRSPRRGRILALSGGLAAAAAVALALLVLPAGDSGPSVTEVAQLYDRGASSPAPPPDPGEPNLLDASVEGVPFPDYRAKFGWSAEGARDDDVEGRDSRTVFYDNRGRRMAYTIVGGEALDWPSDARRTTRDGVELRSLTRGDTTVVTWRRNGRTCVLSASDVPRDELLELAAWKGKGAVTF
jgi:hypothetical protein